MGKTLNNEQFFERISELLSTPQGSVYVSMKRMNTKYTKENELKCFLFRVVLGKKKVSTLVPINQAMTFQSALMAIMKSKTSEVLKKREKASHSMEPRTHRLLKKH